MKRLFPLVVLFPIALAGFAGIENSRAGEIKPARPAANAQTRQSEVPVAWLRATFSVPGYSVEETEQQITGIAEAALNNLPRIMQIESVSYAGEAEIWLGLKKGANPNVELRPVSKVLSRVADWPEQADEPLLKKAADGPMLLFALQTHSHAAQKVSDLSICRAAALVSSRLKRVPQVAEVFTIGKTRLQLAITPDRDKLRAIGLTPRDLAENIEQQFVRVPEIRPNNEFIVRSLNKNVTAESLEAIPIRVGADGRVTRLQDVARVQLRSAFGGELPAPAGDRQWPSGWVLFGVHVDSAENGTACARDVEKLAETLALPEGQNIGRPFDEQRTWIDIAQKLWSRSIPPDLEWQFATTTELGPHLVSRRADILLRITGPDLAELQRLAAECRRRILEDADVAEARIIGGENRPELNVTIDREKSAALGLTNLDVMKQLRYAIANQSITDVDVDGLPAEIVLLANVKDEKRKTPLAGIRLELPEGKSIALEQICKVERRSVPVAIRHRDLMRAVSIRVMKKKGAGLIGNALRTQLAGYETELKKRQPGYDVEWVVAE